MKLSDIVQLEPDSEKMKIVPPSPISTKGENIGLIPLSEIGSGPINQYSNYNLEALKQSSAVVSPRKAVVWAVVHIFNKEQGLAEAAVAANAGADGVFFINHHGDDDLTHSLALLFKDAYPHMRVGVNFLSLSPLDAVSIAIQNDICNVWLDNAGVNTSMTDFSLLGSIRDKIRSTPGLMVFGGVAFKYQRQENNPVEAVKLAERHGVIPTTSGAGTGIAADLCKIETMGGTSTFGLAIASGLDVDNIDDYLPYIKHAIVATGVSVDEHHFDKEKLKAFVNKTL